MFGSIFNRARRGAHSLALAGSLGLLVAGVVTPLAGFATAPTGLCAPTDYKCVIGYGDTAIAARQTALTKLNSRVTEVFSDGRITSSDNAALTSDISANESGLSQLKTKLDADTDATTARADFKSIYTTYRIFAVVLPRDYHEVWMDMLIHTDNRLAGAETIIQDAINGAPSSVQAQATTLFQDYKTQVTNAQAQTTAAQQIIPQLTPTAFNTNRTGYTTSLGSLKTDLQTAHLATRTAISDLHQIIHLLKSAS